MLIHCHHSRWILVSSWVLVAQNPPIKLKKPKFAKISNLEPEAKGWTHSFMSKYKMSRVKSNDINVTYDHQCYNSIFSDHFRNLFCRQESMFMVKSFLSQRACTRLNLHFVCDACTFEQNQHTKHEIKLFRISLSMVLLCLRCCKTCNMFFSPGLTSSCYRWLLWCCDFENTLGSQDYWITEKNLDWIVEQHWFKSTFHR